MALSKNCKNCGVPSYKKEFCCKMCLSSYSNKLRKPVLGKKEIPEETMSSDTSDGGDKEDAPEE